MSLNWKVGGLLLGLVFFAAVLLVKPIGVSTQFVILDGIVGDAVNPALVTQTDEGYTSTNAYLAKSNGKYAKSVANPLNYSFVFVLAMALGGFSTLGGWQDFLWIVAIGCFGGMAVLCLVVSFRMTEQSNLAPFTYFGIPTAFFFGWIFFDEAPWQDLFPGAILIIAGGLLVIWRQRRLRQG